MPTIRDMMNAHAVVSKLASNPNVFVTTSFKFLPVLSFLTEVVDAYYKTKESIITKDIPPEEKEILLNAQLDLEVEVPDVSIGINTLRNCGLTMIDIQNISWWLVEYEDEYED